MDGHTGNWRMIVVAVASALLLGVAATGSSAQVVGAPDVIGQWTEPFEEGGAGTPRCVPADDGSGFVVCKPTAQAAAVLPDGRIMYYNGIESQENAKGPSAMSLSPSSRDSQARVLDLRTGTPQFVVPAQGRGAMANPNIKEGHQSYDDPMAAVGVPGRPGDGFVGSTWGQVGGEPHDPASSPDDTSANDGDMFCGDLTGLPDGRVLIAGGTDWYNEPALMDRNNGDPADVGAIELEGLRSSSIFDPATNTFTPTSPMKYGRWYPHVAIGPDGSPTVFSGVTQLITDTQLSQVRRTETFDAASGTWAENSVGPESENSLPLQPRIHLTPDGKFTYAGVGQMWGPFGQAVDEATYNFIQQYDPQTKAWSIAGVAPLGARSGAFQLPLQMTPPYHEMTLVQFGGVLGPPPGTWIPANAFTTMVTVDANSNISTAIGPDMNYARWFASGVVLPTGELLAVGGADKDEVIDPGVDIPVHQAELYNPAANSWTEVASHTRDRAYHNSALLLPDMRVLLGGHAPIGSHYGGANSDQGGPFTNNDNDPSFEVWSPPYLFRGARPTITSAQAGVSYNETFTVGTPQARDIESVVLLRTPSPEHVNDSDQRNLALDFTVTDGNHLQVEAPPSGRVAPPGYYYLVVMKKSLQGPVPSVARMVQVGVGTDMTDALQPYPDDNPAPTGGSATPDMDSSQAAAASGQAAEATKAAPAPVNGPEIAGVEADGEAGSAVEAASEAYGQLNAVPASNPAPFSSPALPAAALGVAGTAGLVVRRWLRRRI